MVAYEWDPVTGAFAVTSDTASLVGVPPARIATLADWLSHVATDERDAMQTAFALRADGGAMTTLSYRVQRADGTPVALTDEAQAIRDHDGSLHRITGIARVS
jgi:PAS domain-containing protein